MACPRAFISYSTRDRIAAAQIRDALAEVGFRCFVAHDDLLVSEEWRDRIIEELRACELFIPLLSAAFKSSEWTSQEVGFAVAREIPIIPLLLDGTVPYGFIRNFQGRAVEATSLKVEMILVPLAKRNLRLAAPAMILRVREVGSFDAAEFAMEQLTPFLGSLTPTEVEHLADAIANNGQVWNSGGCRTVHIPAFFNAAEAHIPGYLREAIEYQIENSSYQPRVEA